MDDKIYEEWLDLLSNKYQSFGYQNKIMPILEKVSNGTATWNEIYQLADDQGGWFSSAFNQIVNKHIDENGYVPLEVAQSSVAPGLQTLHDDVCTIVSNKITQENLNAGYTVNGVIPKLNQDRIDGIVSGLVQRPFDKTSYLLNEPVHRYGMNMVDDTIKTNGYQASLSGMRPSITRKAEANCCDWCSNLAGTWEYGKEPHDVYRRHANCRCVVEYHSGNKFQNVHTKEIHEDQYQHSEPSLADTDQFILDAINNNEVQDKINNEKQKRHCSETIDQSVKDSNRSYIYGDVNTAISLYNTYKGTGKPVSDRQGNIYLKERVTCDDIVGVYYDQSLKIHLRTNGLMIIFSKHGSHLYPRKVVVKND